MTTGDRRRPSCPFALLALRLLFVLALVAVGCQKESPSSRTDRGLRGAPDVALAGAADTPPTGNDEEPVLRIPLPSDPGSLNPLVSRQPRQMQFAPLFYPALLRTTARGAAVPDVEGVLARFWQWDPAARALTCRLRHRLWEDTTRVSVHDVVRTYEAYETLGWLARRAPGDTLPDAGLTSVQAVDDSTVRLVYRAGVSFWRALGAASWPILPARKLGQLNASMLQANPLGREPLSAGSFRLSDWRSGLNLWLAPHPFASEGRRPQVDRVEFDVCPGADARILRVQMGRADIALNVPVELLGTLVEARAPVRLHRAGIRSVEMLLWNLRAPWARSEIREAVSLAVDRERIVRTLLSWRGEACGGPAGGLLEPEGPPADSIEGVPWARAGATIPAPTRGLDSSEAAPAVRGDAAFAADPDTAAAPDTIPSPAPVFDAPPVFYAPMPRLDRASADSVLDAAGWGERDAEGFRVRDGLRLRVEVLYDRANLFREQLATLLESDLARVGIEMVPVPVDPSLFWSRLHTGAFTTALAGFRSPDVPDPSALWASWGFWNGTGYASARVDSLCTELAREESPARRLRQARTIESLIRRSGPVTFLIYREWTSLLHERVEGFEGRAGDPLRNLERVRLRRPGKPRAQETPATSRVIR